MNGTNLLALLGYLIYGYFFPPDYPYLLLIPLVIYNKIQDFVGNLGLAAYNLNTDTIRLALALAADPPVATDTVLGNITQPTGTGYAAGGEDTQNTYSEATGTGTLQGTSFMWTAGAADWSNTVRYLVLHDDTVSDQLIAWWDYGGNLALGNGETFSAKFNNAAVGNPGNIFTLA